MFLLRRESEDLAKEKYSGALEKGELEDKITISRHFKEKIVQPILKSHFREGHSDIISECFHILFRKTIFKHNWN